MGRRKEDRRLLGRTGEPNQLSTLATVLVKSPEQTVPLLPNQTLKILCSGVPAREPGTPKGGQI